jgi:hypothetical protein
MTNTPVQKGFNTDITHLGKSYHIQTEDWGFEKEFIVTRVFCNGAVLKTVKTTYEQALRGGPVNDSKAIALALRNQHQLVLDQVTQLS